MATATDNSDIFNTLSATLTELGLGSLFSMSGGKPGGWLWEQIVSGRDTMDQLQVSLESTNAYKQRFGIITEMRQRSAAGENVHVPSMGEVREFEDKAASMMRQAGLPTWFYDNYKDTQALMRKDIALPELEQRIAQGWSTVRDADPAVRQAFTDFYGVGTGDAALAAFVLDPTHTMSAVERASRAAYTAGYGKSMNLNIDKNLAERVADLPTTTAGIQQSLGEAARMSNVAVAGITEGSDITASSLVEATTLGNATELNKVSKRLTERQANDRSNQGGALQTQQGIIGLRSV
jgi:hypothetical protein